jgi:cytosine/adenosine deaminase-related metal-dependent hydrolase
LISYRAGWVLPIGAPPIRDGWVTVHNGRIVGVGPGMHVGNGRSEDLGRVAVLPGLVNAHTHLELSHFREQVPAAANFVSWVRQVIALQRSRSRPNAPEIMDAIHSAIREAERCGTAVIGDISNTLVTVRALAESALAAVVFYELIRFNTTDALGVVEQAQRAIDAVPATAMVRASLAAHAPYSVAPDLFRAIARINGQRPCSVHLAESREEVEFIRSGTGPWRTLLQELGSWDADWAAPGGTAVEFLDGCGFLDSRLLAVHGVQMTRGDLARLAERGVTLVTCPRSNAYTGAGPPPVADFYASGVRVAVGTDSEHTGLERVLRTARIAPAGAVRAGGPIAGQRDAAGRARAGIRRRVRHDRGGEVGASDRGQRPGRRRGCGRISGQRNSTRSGQVDRRKSEVLSQKSDRFAPLTSDFKLATNNVQASADLRVVRQVQPFRVRAAVRPRRCVAGAAAATAGV